MSTDPGQAGELRRIQRLVSVGNAVVDIVTRVQALPQRGSDVFADAGGISPGGNVNVMVAAARQGLATVYAGAHGSGPFGELVRAVLHQEGVGVLHRPAPKIDTGFDVAMVDDSGERTFVTVVGAEAGLTSDLLNGIELTDTDAVYVSGYSLLHPINRASITEWIDTIPLGCTVLFDPGPLVAKVDPDALEAVSGRADWWSGNLREAKAVTQRPDALAAASAIAEHYPRAVVIVRTGPDGCVLAEQGRPAMHVPGFAVTAVDTNGAGDAHVGAFLAALSRGVAPVEAARLANAGAAIAVTRTGPATGPTLDELNGFLARHA